MFKESANQKSRRSQEEVLLCELNKYNYELINITSISLIQMVKLKNSPINIALLVVNTTYSIQIQHVKR